MNSSNVFAAWNERELLGLARILDDSEMVAFIYYVLVNLKRFQSKFVMKEIKIIMDGKMNEAITMFKRLKEIYCSKHNYDFEFIWIII